ncbi:TIGR03862 family flavoprotein [Marinibacterium sp. SX1]|uniref:TIGR03862 family flavoprotein n=1 Tax=Marinibacterium sp. SX1 TaxID=3388424 RepID=UPI003D16563A
MSPSTKTACVIGGGPAGLMAAEVLAGAGLAVTLADSRPSVGRKLLMAGKSGLNLTKDEAPEPFLDAYAEAGDWLAPALAGFGPGDVMAWAEGLGQPLFTGTSGRVFPRAMKGSPLLRAWLARLDGAGVQIRTRWRWTGWDGPALGFETPDGPARCRPDVTILALGGASWARLGSDGAWATILTDEHPAPFAPANAALSVDWSAHMAPVFGQPVKAVAWRAGDHVSRGEAIVSQRGLEGSGIYAVSRGIREGAPLVVDLAPDLAADVLAARLARPRGKASLSNHLRKVLRLDPVKRALLMECARPLPQDPAALAALIKALPVQGARLRPLDEAISTAGGLTRAALDDRLMLRSRPGVFAAGEMLDWEAPTGGYLLTACLATGRWAGQGALDWLAGAPA